MRNINAQTQNLLMLHANEHVRQLEKKHSGMNILKKQIELRERMSDIIYLARTSVKGQVEFVFASTDYPKNTAPEKIMDESLMKVSTFNTLDRKGIMMRTVIVIDPLWSDNYRAYQCQYGYSDLHLQPYEEILKKAQNT